MRNLLLGFILSFVFLSIANASGNTIANNTINATANTITLEIIGLPPGSSFSFDLPPSNLFGSNTPGTLHTYNITGWTTFINIPYNNSMLYSTNIVEYSPPTVSVGDTLGTTVTYNGVTYTLNFSYPGVSLSKLYTNRTDIMPFYALFSTSMFGSWFNNFRNTSWFNTSTKTAITGTFNRTSTKITIAGIINRTMQVQYGNLKIDGNYIPANKFFNTSILQKLNGFGYINLIKEQVVQNSSYACIRLSSPKVLNFSICKPGRYILPLVVINKKFLATNTSTIPITATLQSNLVANNEVPFNALIKVGNIILYNASLTTNSLSFTKTFDYSAGEQLNITLDGLGNANYSVEDPTVVAPSSIVAYAPITISNSQSTATPAPFQQMINITESSFSNYISYNGNIANFEFFYANGTIIPAWIESNSLGKLVTWVNLAKGLPASSSITIYLGFASETTNLLSNSGTAGIGEAPQLSSTYGQYDDGAKVFLSYFNGATPTSDFTVTNTDYTLAQATGVTMPNGNTGDVIHITGYGSASPASYIPFVYNNGYSIQPSVVESSTELAGDTSSDQGLAGILTSTNITSASGIGVAMGYGSSYFTQEYESAGSVTTDLNQQGSSVTSWVYSAVSFYGTSSTSWYGYTAPQLYSTTGGYGGTVTTQPITSGTTLYLSSLGGTGPNYPYDLYINWERARAYPPSGVMPNYIIGSATPPTLTISPNSAFYGQTINITANYSSSSYTIALYINGNLIKEGVASLTYSTSNLSVGAYNVTLEVLNTAISISKTLYVVARPSAPSAIPSGVYYYAPIGITNFQATTTPAPFQQMINITESTFGNYIAYDSNFANFEFFYANGTTIPAWIESNSSGKLITWVKLANGIPASNSIAIYLGFANKTTNLLSNTGTTGIGEAPQLSSTYGQYDDGANVFNFYDNFAGTTLSSKWVNNVGNAGGTLTINNGMSYTRGTSGNLYPFIYSTATFSAGIYETYGNIPAGGASSGYDADVFGLASSSNAGYNTAGVGDLGGIYGLGTSSSTGAYSGAVSGLSGGTYIWQIIIPSSTPSVIYASQNYGTQISSTTDMPTLPQPIIYLDGTNTGINSGPFYWVRVRAYPPNGAMPSYAVGTATTNPFSANTTLSTPTTQIYNGTNYIKAVSKITAGSAPFTFNFSVFGGVGLVANSLVSSSNTTYTYVSKALPAGTYTFNSIVSGNGASQKNTFTITINKATPIISIATPANMIYNGTSPSITANIITYANQLPLNIYINNALIANTTTSISKPAFASAGNYTIVANTIGNGNYLDATASAKFNIFKAKPKLFMGFSSTPFSTTLYNASTLNIQTNSQFTLSLQSYAYNHQLKTNLYVFQLYPNGTIKSYYPSGGVVNQSNLIPYVAFTYFNQTSWSLPKGYYEFEYATGGNQNYTAEDPTLYINQTATAGASTTGAVGGGGGSTPTTTTTPTTITTQTLNVTPSVQVQLPNLGNNQFLNLLITIYTPSIVVYNENIAVWEVITVALIIIATMLYAKDSATNKKEYARVYSTLAVIIGLLLAGYSIFVTFVYFGG